MKGFLNVSEGLKPCFCVGPQNGDPHCPCVMRARKIAGADDMKTFVVAQRGWICPKCGKGNAPWQPICANALCGADTQLMCEAK